MKKSAKDVIKKVQALNSETDSDKIEDLLADYMVLASKRCYETNYDVETMQEEIDAWEEICDVLEDKENRTAMSRFLGFESAYYKIDTEEI